MFTRIQETIRILSSLGPEKGFETPDVIISPKEAVEIHKVSRFIGNAIAILLVVLTAGPVALLFSGLLPVVSHPSLTTWFGIATAALAILGNKFVELINQKLHEQLNIAERVAPYFGRRLYESYRILRS